MKVPVPECSGYATTPIDDKPYEHLIFISFFSVQTSKIVNIIPSMNHNAIQKK